MSNVQIPNLPAGTGLSGSEQLESVQGGTSVRITTNQIASYAQSTYPAPGVSSITVSSPLSASPNPITSTGTISLATSSVSNTYLSNMPAYTVKANVTGSTGAVTDASASQVLDTIGSVQGSVLYRGASSWQALAPGTSGYVLSTTGPSGNPQWVAQVSYNPASVAITGGTINGTTIGNTSPAAGTFTNLSVTGTFNLTSPLSVASGGTGVSTLANNGVVYGKDSYPVGVTAAGQNNQVLLGNTNAAPSWGQVNLAGAVTGTLPATNGGTGFPSYTTGDLLYADSSNTLARLNDVATGNALISGGVGVAPSWGKIGLTTHVSGTLPVANGGTGITSFGTGVATALGQNVTGSGGIVLATSPTLTTPNLGTPSAAVLTNATGLPLTTGVTGTLPVANGGSGATTLSGWLFGNGTSAFTAFATIPNSGLTNSSVTIGSTNIALGGTSTTLAGLTTVTLTQDPTLALQASTKQYVDNTVATVANLTYHTAAVYATTADLGSVTYSNGAGGVGATLTNAGTQAALAIDGYTFTATDVTNATRVLVKNESNAAYNGVYTVTNQGSVSTNWVLTRATDFNTTGSGPNYIETGAAVFVSNGTTNGSTSWVLTTTGTITVGSTALAFTQNSSSGSFTVSAPLAKTGNNISLNTVTVPYGGTGLTTLTQYGVMLGAGTGNVAFASPGTTGYPLLSNGAAANPSFGQLSLTTGVTGTLPIANGGTGITSFGTGVQTALGQAVTGSGGIVLATSPTLTTPNLGTPSALTLTNATGLPLSSGVTGTLPVGNGGTGTSTAFTQGSVVFAGSSGTYSQNNSKFFWDNTNIRLGLNTASPNTTLNIVSNTQTATPPSAGSLPAGTDFYILGANAANTRITQDAYGTGNYPSYTGRQARGTAALPTASQTGDTLAQFTGRGYGATGFASASVARLDMYAAENYTDTAQGTYLSFFTTPTGTTSITEQFRIGPSGQFGIGGATYGTSGYVLTSGGAAAAPTWSQVSASSLTGTLPVANGGTGVTTLTAHGVVIGNGTSAVNVTTAGTTGYPLLSGGASADPAFGQLSLSGSGITGTLGLSNGGTNASLTASNGGIIYSTASAMAVLSGTATANQVLLSGSSGAPSWSTATYPATTTVNQLLYSGTANVVSGLATANSSVLVTNGAGVPSWSTTLPAHTVTTSVTVPLVIGGSGTTGTQLTLQTTTGIGTTDAIAFKGGNNGATTFATLAAAGLAVTSTGSNAFAVGPAGTTNPSFNVDASTASAATGLNVKSAAAGGGLAVSVISSGSNENLTINAKGTGTIGIGSVSTGAVTITPATTLSNALTYGGVTLSNSVTGTGSMVLSTSPSLTTPALGVATATSINKVTITAPATSATLTIADGKTLTANGSVTFNGAVTYTGTDGTTMTFPSSSATVAGLGIAQTFTATQTFSGSSSTASAVLQNALETATVSATAATGTINFYLNSQSVLYYTSNASANWTVNFAFSSGTSLNTAMATGQSVTAVFLVTQGSTAYYNSAVQIDGSSVTPKWQGGSAPTVGNASGVDVYSYTIIKTASATYTVLAAQTQFK